MRSTYKTRSNREVVRKCQAIFVYFPWVMRRQGEPAETTLDATGLCNDLSLCTMEIANIIEWINAGYKIDRTYVKDSLGLCDSCWPLMFSHHTDDHVGDSTLEARTFKAVTGIEIDGDALLTFGETIFNQQRAILLREGWTPGEDDTIADFNFTDPVQSVFMNDEVLVPGEGDIVLSRKGQIIDREVFKKMRDEFYHLRGWDPETAYPGKEKLHELGLSDLADVI